jgi:hypothetical protein
MIDQEQTDRMKSILFNQLLITEEKTTGMLENLVGARLYVHVIQQKNIDGHMIRESILYTKEEHFIVSHNFALIDPEQIPKRLHEKIIFKKNGIGESMNDLSLESSRDILSYGWRKKEDIFGFSNTAICLRFDEGETSIPFKEYTITFHHLTKPGISLIEYFNPRMIRSPMNLEI